MKIIFGFEPFLLEPSLIAAGKNQIFYVVQSADERELIEILISFNSFPSFKIVTCAEYLREIVINSGTDKTLIAGVEKEKAIYEIMGKINEDLQTIKNLKKFIGLTFQLVHWIKEEDFFAFRKAYESALHIEEFYEFTEKLYKSWILYKKQHQVVDEVDYIKYFYSSCDCGKTLM